MAIFRVLSLYQDCWTLESLIYSSQHSYATGTIFHFTDGETEAWS